MQDAQEWAKMGREALRLCGSELHHFVLAASCFLAASESAAGDEEAMQEGGSVVTPAQVQAALRAAVKAHKRFTEKKQWKDLTTKASAATSSATQCTAHHGLATEQPLYVCTRCTDTTDLAGGGDPDGALPVVCGPCVRRCHMHKEHPKKGRLPRHILPIARSKRNAICECGTAKFDGAKQEECTLVGTDSKSDMAWLNAPDRSFTLEYCTDKCTESHRVKPGHCWDDEDELVACVYCRTDFHADCVEAEDQKKEEFVCGACLADRVPHLQAYLRTPKGDHGPRVLGRSCLGGCFLIKSWRQEIIKDEREIMRRTAEVVRYGLRPLAVVLSALTASTESNANSDDDDDGDDDDELEWAARADEAVSLLTSFVKIGDDDYADYAKQIRQEAHKAGLPALLLSLLLRCRAVLVQSSRAAQAQRKKQHQRKYKARQEEARSLAATICAALTWTLKDEEEAQDVLGKKSLSAVLLDLLSHEIDADEDAGKASLSLNAASALATCLMNSPKSQSGLAADEEKVRQLWSLIRSCKCDDARATVLAYVLYVYSNTVVFFSDEMKEEMTDRAKLSLLLEIVTDSDNPGVRLHATRALAHLARGDENTQRTIRREGGVEQLAKLFLGLNATGGGSKDDPHRHAVLILLLVLCQDPKCAARLLSVKRVEKALTRLRKDEDASFPLRLCANDILGAGRPTSRPTTPIKNNKNRGLGGKAKKQSSSSSGSDSEDELSTRGHVNFLPPPLFTRLGLLGRGAFAKVYKVRVSPSSDRVYALKQIQLWNKYADPFYFYTEAQILKDVDHENVIKTHSIYQDHSAMYFLQDLMDTTLDSVIHSTAVIGDKAAPLPLPLLLDVCLGIARGMDYLHTLPHPILHRDLKPENLLLRLEGQGQTTKLRGLKITDFGVSRYLNNPHSAEVERGMTQAMGTTGYISPEMAVGMRLAQDELWLKSDVWSFGVIISELLSRRKPYYGKITNEVSSIIESVTVTVRDGSKKKRKANNNSDSADADAMPFHEDQLLGRPPKALVDLMRRCLSLTISARPSFSDAVEVLEELKQSLHSQSEDENEAAAAAAPSPLPELEVKRPKRLAKRRAKPAVPPPQADEKQEQPAPQAVVPTACMVLTPQQQPKVRRVVRRRNKVLLAPASASCAPTQDDDEEEQVVEDKENVKPLANRLKKMRL